MSATARWHWFAAVTRRLGRKARVALGVSIGLHLCAVGVLGLVRMTAEPAPVEPLVAATIVEPPELAPALERLALTLEPDGDSSEGGSSFDTPAIAFHTGDGLHLDLASSWIGAGDGVPTTDGISLSERVAPLGGGGAGGGSYGSGEGNGIGNGVGDGTGTSFFGVAGKGQNFVFVVDASSSMRRPSHGPERTLFNRVKLEILQSIRRMSANQKFYIVFFNDAFFPMPATSMVAATEDAQARYLQWMAEVKSGGQTDPEGAIQLALQLQPDVIYFLTDGEFRYGLVKRIAAMNRSGVVIHTVCFGGTEDRSVTLRQIAEQNGGEFHFVPLPAPAHETAAKTSPADATATP